MLAAKREILYKEEGSFLAVTPDSEDDFEGYFISNLKRLHDTGRIPDAQAADFCSDGIYRLRWVTPQGTESGSWKDVTY